MAIPRSSLPPSYFDAIYEADPDPWRYATSPYEAAKYAATLAALPRSRYASGLETGCSIGVFTEQLAARCDRLLAVDTSSIALAHARARCRPLAHVHFAKMWLPHEYPGGPFDLTLLAEVGYFWCRPDLALARERILAQLDQGGHLLLVHWLPPEPDHRVTADEVHDAFLSSAAELRHLAGHRTEHYRLDLFERR